MIKFNVIRLLKVILKPRMIYIKDDKFLKHTKRKIQKHFTILVNDQKVKILKFKKSSYQDRFGEEISTIKLITKIDNLALRHRRVKIEIEDEPTTIGTFVAGFSRPGLRTYTYRITESDS
ncbi:hypothetical protein J2Z48_000261 [Croceifilum oryzae]|uniref:Uncharacterized protein n=1 Tax=Croceifilum oryzae TaxID=1553429 RepID=A0AAJ1TC73_9BACL|nr:hypothetical protein [Croceifilum oryzae]MDQ0416103.1 hypothetical protein [Croceifilum oryzae]